MVNGTGDRDLSDPQRVRSSSLVTRGSTYHPVPTYLEDRCSLRSHTSLRSL